MAASDRETRIAESRCDSSVVPEIRTRHRARPHTFMPAKSAHVGDAMRPGPDLSTRSAKLPAAMKWSNSMSTARSTTRRNHASTSGDIGPQVSAVSSTARSARSALQSLRSVSNDAVEREAEHVVDVRIRQPVDAARVVEKVRVLGAVRVDRLLQPLAAVAKRRRRIERHIDAADRAQRQAIERDVDDGLHGGAEVSASELRRCSRLSHASSHQHGN